MLSADKLAYVFLFIILAIVYHLYLYKSPDDYNAKHDNLVNKFLLYKGESKNKTKLWIHIPTEYNSLKWSSFGSRSSHDVNIDYLYLCMQSILRHNKNNDVLIITDSAFNTLLPNFNIDLNQLADPVKSKVRQLCLTKLLFKYGGILTPFNFLCMKDLNTMFDESPNNPFVVEVVDNSFNSNEYFQPSCTFMGVKQRQNSEIGRFVQFLEELISTDATDASNFLDRENKWCLTEINQNRLDLISGSNIITKTLDNKPVTIELLFENDLFKYNTDAYGLYIPHNDISIRTKYNWFLQLNRIDIKTCDTVLCYFFQKYT